MRKRSNVNAGAGVYGGLIVLTFWASRASAGELQKLLEKSETFAALPAMTHTPAFHLESFEPAQHRPEAKGKQWWYICDGAERIGLITTWLHHVELFRFSPDVDRGATYDIPEIYHWANLIGARIQLRMHAYHTSIPRVTSFNLIFTKDRGKALELKTEQLHERGYRGTIEYRLVWDARLGYVLNATSHFVGPEPKEIEFNNLFAGRVCESRDHHKLWQKTMRGRLTDGRISFAYHNPTNTPVDDIQPGGFVGFVTEERMNPFVELIETTSPVSIVTCSQWYDQHIVMKPPQHREADGLYHQRARYRFLSVPGPVAGEIEAAAVPAVTEGTRKVLGFLLNRPSDFEQFIPHDRVYNGGIWQHISRNDEEAHSGKYSLKVTGRGRGTAACFAPIGGGTGVIGESTKRYRLTAWIKTNLSEGTAYVRVDDAGWSWNDVRATRITKELGGRSDWTHVAVEFQPGPNDPFLVVRICVDGRGAAWFDDLCLKEIGVPAPAPPAAPVREERTPRDLTPVTWLDTPAHPPVELVRDGRARAALYVADPAPSAKLELLVGELVEVIRLSTGATLKRVTDAPAADQPVLVIGDCQETRRAGIDATDIPIEGFEIKTALNRIYLVGSTKALPPGSDRWAQWSNEGAAWAVADFLERFVGVRWYWPVEVGGRSVTPAQSLLVPPVNYRDHPVFRKREYHPRHGWRLPSKARSSDKAPLPFPPGAIPEGVEVIDMATYLPLVRGGNSWPYEIKVHQPQNLGRLPSEFHEENKEIFALKKDGSRSRHMFCYSSQGALDYLLEGCERVWTKGGGGRPWVTSTCVTVSPGDSAVECHCDACRKTYAEGGGTRIDGTSLIMARFVKRMCEAVKERWPDKRVIYLPYWNYDACSEEVDYPDNLVMSAMTTYPMALNVQKQNFQEALERLRAWRSKACLPITLWDYCVCWTYGPYQYPHVVRDFHDAIKDVAAGTFINGENLGEWTTTAPTLYVWMKVLWNPDLDVDAVLDEMCRRLFGTAGATSCELLRRECELWEAGEWKNRRVKIRGGWYVPRSLDPRVWKPDSVRQLKALRDKALAELHDDPVARQRFLYWTWAFDAFLKEAEAR